MYSDHFLVCGYRKQQVNKMISMHVLDSKTVGSVLTTDLQIPIESGKNSEPNIVRLLAPRKGIELVLVRTSDQVFLIAFANRRLYLVDKLGSGLGNSLSYLNDGTWILGESGWLSNFRISLPHLL